jgi:hypothetical protein
VVIGTGRWPTVETVDQSRTADNHAEHCPNPAHKVGYVQDVVSKNGSIIDRHHQHIINVGEPSKKSWVACERSQPFAVWCKLNDPSTQGFLPTHNPDADN